MALLPHVKRSTPWHAGRVEYRKITGYDLYGAPSGYDHAVLPATVRRSSIEVMEAGGTRARRQGLVCEVTPQAFFAVNDHLVHDGQEYTIIGVDAPRTSLLGRSYYVVLTAVAKRGNV